MPTRNFLAKRYELHEVIGKGGMGVIYRATDHLNQNQVALKQVLHPSLLLNNDENIQLRFALTNEFKTLAALHHPHIINVMDYGFHDMRPFFTMDYLHHAQSIFTVKTASLEEKIRLFIPVLQALIYLHQHNILHCDLKPSNILYSATQGVKLLDFGLAQNHITLSQALQDHIVGTVEYLAPEVLQGHPPTVQSDLFAFGVVLAEAILGRHPFQRPTITQTISAILTDEPDLDDLSPELRLVLSKLMNKNAPERHKNAYVVLSELCDTMHIPYPQESSMEREYVLQSPAFVGRTPQREQLFHALKNIQSGGQFWLVGGESGVGKSRLLDELRTQALVEGVIVLRGQGVEGGGLPFQLWRDSVHRLILNENLADLEASILKEILPEIDSILKYAVSAPPRLDGIMRIKRLALALVALFRKQSEPLLIILEDLHWTIESLDILKYVVPLIDQLPILIVGSYRTELMADLPKQFTDAKTILLDRLPKQDIREMCASIVGDVALDNQFNAILMKETEGNPLFVIEILRVLADQVGGLHAISPNAIPITIFAGGINKILEQRIVNLPQWALHPLKLAAVLGKKIDIRLLHTIYPDISYEQWIHICSHNAILELRDEEWYFSHDKLREAAIATLSAEEFKQYHRHSAKAIETIHGKNPQYFSQLASHWRQANDTLQDFEYCLLAGEYALQSFVLSTAYQFFDHARDIYPQVQTHLTDASAKWAKLLHQYGIVLWRSGDGKTAKPYLIEALTYYRQMNDLEQASWVLETLGTVCWRLGELKEAQAYLHDCIAYAQDHSPLLHAYALNRMGTTYYSDGDKQTAIEWLIKALPIVRDVGEAQIIGHVVGNLGMLSTELGNLDQAQIYLDEALLAYRRQNNIIGEAHALTNLGHLAYQQSKIQEADSYYRRAIRLTQQSGDTPTALEDLAGLARIQEYPCDALRLCALVMTNSASMDEALDIAKIVVATKTKELGEERAKHYLEQGYKFTLNHAMIEYSA